MQLVPTQVDNSTALSAVDFNPIPLEEENAIRDTNQTLSGSDLYQLSRAMAAYAGIGNFYIDSGSANVYVINKTTFTPPFQIRPLTELFTGASFRFIPANTNTGASTINIDSLGVKNIKLPNGADTPPGSILAGIEIIGYYDGTNAVITNSPIPVLATQVTRVYQSVSQTIGANTILALDTAEFDTTGAFNLTSYQFNPKIPGYYNLSLNFMITGAQESENYGASIRKNGTVIAIAPGTDYEGPGTPDDLGTFTSTITYLNGTTDYVDLIGQYTTGTRSSLPGLSGTFFCAFLISN